MNVQVYRSSKWRKRKTNFMSLTALFVRMTKVMKWWKVTYQLSISECTNSRSSKWRKRKINFMSLATLFVTMIKFMNKWKATYTLSIRKCTSPRSSKWRKRKINFMSLTPHFVRIISYEAVKSNLPPEHKWMHKFTEVASGKRAK